MKTLTEKYRGVRRQIGRQMTQQTHTPRKGNGSYKRRPRHRNNREEEGTQKYKGRDYSKYTYVPKFNLVKKNPFDIKKLVDKGIIHVTAPGDGKGGIAKPNWEGDASVITLHNLWKAAPWMKKAITMPAPKAIPHIQKDQEHLFYNGKYNQILWSIKKKGYRPEEFYLRTKTTSEMKLSKIILETNNTEADIVND